MFNSKLTSVRFNEHTLNKIDAFCKKHPYYKRSYVINLLLAKALEAAVDNDGNPKSESANLFHLNLHIYDGK